MMLQRLPRKLENSLASKRGKSASEKNSRRPLTKESSFCMNIDLLLKGMEQHALQFPLTIVDAQCCQQNSRKLVATRFLLLTS